MVRISVTVNEDTYLRIKKMAAQRQISMAQCLRELVNIGLQEQEAAGRRAMTDRVVAEIKDIVEEYHQKNLEVLHRMRVLTHPGSVDKGKPFEYSIDDINRMMS